MRWLAYALGTTIPTEPAPRRWATVWDGYAGLVAAALLTECQRLLRGELRRDYVSRQRTDTVLRGSLNPLAQATRSFGQLDRLHLRTFDRESEVPDNQVLSTALTMVLRTVDDPDLARDVAQTVARFPRGLKPPAAIRTLARISYTHTNLRYRAAHTWARLILHGGGVTDLLADSGAAADTLLLDMPKLWEQVVRRLAVDASGIQGVPGSSGGGITVSGDLGKDSMFRPDLLLPLPSHTGSQPRTLPIDAKYKRYDRHGIGAGDVHQLLTYASGYATDGDPTALIVHPHPAKHTGRRLVVDAPSGTLGVIHVLGIDVNANTADAVLAIRAVLRDVQRRSAGCPVHQPAMRGSRRIAKR
jgi:5-methylcytosine-specific restriction enzyme subunit McrC